MLCCSGERYRAIMALLLLLVTPEYRGKRVICKTWTRTLANSADSDQTLQNAASDQGLPGLLKLQEVKG